MGVLQGFATKREYTGGKADDAESSAGGAAAPAHAPSTAETAAPQQPIHTNAAPAAATIAIPKQEDSRALAALKHLCCGGVAGSVAKTVTAPFSRLTILYQVHSMVTSKDHRPKFALNLGGGFEKIVERGGIMSLWKGNGTSVIHRFPFSAINFYVYENMLDIINGINRPHEDEDGHPLHDANEDAPTTKLTRFIAGATAGSVACSACYPLDLVRTRLTTELEGKEHYRGISDAFRKIYQAEGLVGLYSGIGPTLLVAVPNFAISLTVYGSLKEYALDDELFYNMRKIDTKSGEEALGFYLTLLCGAASGCLSTLVTFPFDTVRRRMQIQNLHIAEGDRLTGRQQIETMVRTEGVKALYRGLTPELLKVLPMVGTMFLVYEFMKEQLNVKKR